MEELSSLMIVTQLMIAPAQTPGSIIGTVTRVNVVISDAPSEIAASSMLGLICPSAAALERTVYGMRRTLNAMIMMSIVPLMRIGGLLKAKRKAMPSTEPGMMNGNIVTVSSALLTAFRLRTLR